jgi:stage II sporulation protein D
VTAEFLKAGASQPVLVRRLEISPWRGGLLPVLPTDLESYVAGVVAGEAAIFRAPAAREAMAILARTWALRRRGRHQAEGFDFCTLTHCQVFRSLVPGAAEDPAVHRTQGQVLQFRGNAVDPYYSADCGGMTEAAGNVWPDSAQPYLVTLRDPYCAGSEHATWRRVMPLEQAEQILRRDMRVALGGPLTRIAIAKSDLSGRAQVLRVEAGIEKQVDANAFRYTANQRWGWATLESNLYTIDQQGGALVFEGRGLGHGVGLCQAGAEAMGRMGQSAEQILAFYFPGTRLAALPDPAADLSLSSEHFAMAFPASQREWAPRALETLERVRREVSARVAQTGSPWSAALSHLLGSHIRVRTFETTSEFIHASGQPGWAAASNDGESIDLQPLSLLERKGILETTLRHELMHLVVHHARAASVPQWYEEGLVLYLTHQQAGPGGSELAPGRSLEEAISSPRSEAEMKAAYALALERVRRIAAQRGEAALWRILREPAGEERNWVGER